MAAPTVSDRLTELLASRYIDGDTVNNAVLDALIGAIADAADKLGIIAFGTDTIPPGHALKDPSVAPDWALAHAAQYVGATLPGRQAGEAQADWLARARDAAVYPFGIKRGTEEAVQRAVQPLLTGTKTVAISYTTDPYEVVVRTQPSETPDQTAVILAIEGDYVSGGHRGALPAERKLTYQLSDQPLFSEATLTFDVMPLAVTANNVTLGDVT